MPIYLVLRIFRRMPCTTSRCNT